MNSDRNEVFLVSREEGVLTLTINRPEQRNALTQSMWLRLAEILGEIEADPAARVIVFRGAGRKAFGAGQDIAEFRTATSPEAAARFADVCEGVWERTAQLQKPTIAMIHGFCMGAACGLAVACDLRVAADTASFGVPSARLGVVYSYPPTKRLVDLIGPAHTKRILLTGDSVRAEEALRIGLINYLVPADELETFTRGLATRIASNAPISLRASKEMVALCNEEDFERVKDRALSLRLEGYSSSDFQEGLAAFLAKRQPKFKGE